MHGTDKDKRLAKLPYINTIYIQYINTKWPTVDTVMNAKHLIS